jgi:hypothetical protein
MRATVKLLTVIALANCAPQGPGAPGGPGSGLGVSKEKMLSAWFRQDSSHFQGVVRAPMDSVWRLLPSAFQSLHFPGAASVYTDDRVYVTPPLKIERRLYPGESNSLYLDCGFTATGQPAADEYRVIFAMMARLLPHSSGGTRVDIIVDGAANNMAERMPPVHCTGTGRLEAVVFSILEDSLRAHH